jgi:hypothetical protein
MNNRTYSILIALILGLLPAMQAGCLVVAAAAGTGAGVAYVRGDLDTTVEANPKQVAAATEKAFADLEFHLISHESSAIDAKLVGRTARDVKMTVVIKGEGERLSKLSIRAGTFGDDAMQDRLLQKIKSHLSPTTATTLY